MRPAFVRVAAGALLAVAAAITSAAASAQAYPNKPIRLLVPFAAGGPSEIVARLLAQRVSDKFGQPIVIENIGGAGGTLAANQVVKAPADGYTLFYANASTLSSSPILFKGAAYDPQKSFSAIGTVAQFHLIFAAHPSVPAETLAEFVALAKSQPGKFSYATPGIGTTPHLAAELMNQELGTALVNIPYKGAAPMMVDLTAGRVQVAFDQPVLLLPQLRQGKLKALFTTRSQRYEALPNVPTARELGMPSFDFGSWAAMVGPAGLPAPVMDAWARELQTVAKDRDFQAALEQRGFDVFVLGPTPTRELIAAEYAKWEKVIRAANIRVD